MKRCTKCGETKLLAEFGVDRANVGTGRKPACSDCIKAYKRSRADITRVRQRAYDNARYADPVTREIRKARSRAWYAANRDKARASGKVYRARTRVARAANERRRTYGLGDDELAVMVLRSEGMCDLCGRPFASSAGTCIDHCHDTGRVRGLLCRRCNTALGTLGDTTASLRRVVAYTEVP